MGGRPLFALNLVGWPRGVLPFELLADVLRGAGAIAQRAGCLMLGGHSIDDPEPKFGMVILGDVHPDRMMTNAAARPGDLLVLTKPLGTGILTTALKRDLIGERDLDDAVATVPATDTMEPLNRLLAAEKAGLVRRLIGELASDRDRQVLFRFYIAEEERERICADLGLTSPELNVVLFRARQRYRKLFEERLGGRGQ